MLLLCKVGVIDKVCCDPPEYIYADLCIRICKSSNVKSTENLEIWNDGIDSTVPSISHLCWKSGIVFLRFSRSLSNIRKK